ncbi:MAG: RNA polymerase sigma factor [Planctomycetes bacterium]|nr:RNA polymerase sigma factor [Planctomycetota bacterium]
MSERARDEEVVRRARAGDRQAFGELLGEHLPGLRAFLFRMGAEDADLDDLAQEVFVAVIRGLKDFRGAGRFSTWLLGIAVNVLRRRRRVREAPLEVARPEVDPAPGPLDVAVRQEQGDLLRRALGRLSPPLREAFVLCDVQGMGAAEAALILAAPEGTVRRRAHDARERLRALLAARELTP